MKKNKFLKPSRSRSCEALDSVGFLNLQTLTRSATIFALLLSSAFSLLQASEMETIKVSDNGRYFVDAEGEPFFWLGDTAWLLPKKLSREEVARYLEDRREKEMNVVQVMVLHNFGSCDNYYGVPALKEGDLNQLVITPGNTPGEGDAYDYWDHLEYAVQLAETKGIYMALVPIWGSNVKAFDVKPEAARAYGEWIGKRFARYPNIIWLNGGDVDASDAIDVWDALAEGILSSDTSHLMTYHPRGRLQSSMWFHERDWLDFNMFQSGHRTYDQDDSELNYGEDNWKYVKADWQKAPAKPTLDGEPSYEEVPYGLHFENQPVWLDDDVRRYAYWSVFAGAAGFTYGHNSIMQFHRIEDGIGSFDARTNWTDSLDAPGAWQMRFLKRLMESRPQLNRVPAQEIVANNTGKKYDYMLATKGDGYAYIYTYTGNEIAVNMDLLEGGQTKAIWYNPRIGATTEIGIFENTGIQTFQPLGAVREGNDWVLILDTI